MMPRLTEVFLLKEASAHAFQNLGYPPAAKQAFEQIDQKFSYELAILTMVNFNLDDRKAMTDPESTMVMLQGVIENQGRVAKAYENYLPFSQGFIKEIRSAAARWAKMPSKEIAGEIDALFEKYKPDLEKRHDGVRQKTLSKKPALKWKDGWAWYKLTDDDEVDYEGQAMNHCARAYGSMYSLRDPTGKPHVTIDLDTLRNQISQCRGNSNETPKEEYWPAVRAFADKFDARVTDKAVDGKFRKFANRMEEYEELFTTSPYSTGLTWFRKQVDGGNLYILGEDPLDPYLGIRTTTADVGVYQKYQGPPVQEVARDILENSYNTDGWASMQAYNMSSDDRSSIKELFEKLPMGWMLPKKWTTSNIELYMELYQDGRAVGPDYYREVEGYDPIADYKDMYDSDDDVYA